MCSSVFYTDFNFSYVSFVFIGHFPQRAKYVWNKADFDAVIPRNTDFLLGKQNNHPADTAEQLWNYSILYLT